jgi:hypothetical protein
MLKQDLALLLVSRRGCRAAPIHRSRCGVMGAPAGFRAADAGAAGTMTVDA